MDSQNVGKNRGLVAIVVLAIAFFLMLMAFAFFASKAVSGAKEDSFIMGDKSKNGPIAVVEVNGAIMSSKEIIEKLQQAEKKKKFKAIILRINSPGGAVAPCQEIYGEIVRIDQKKPIYASFGSVAASGGYYLGAATRRIYSNAGTITGSIGVIMQMMDASKLYELAKLKPEIIKAGIYKDIGSPHRPMKDNERSIMNSMISGVHKQFMNDILKRRKEKIVGDLVDHAQGQIFSGEDAKKLGLVDEVGSLWQAGRAIFDELKLEGEFGFSFIKKKKKFSWLEFMENVEESILDIREFVSKVDSPQLLFRM